MNLITKNDLIRLTFNIFRLLTMSILSMMVDNLKQIGAVSKPRESAK